MGTMIAPGVWHVDLAGTNAYVVEDGDATTLVDAGMPWHADRIADALRVAAGGPEGVDRVLVTHYDFDHVGGLGRIDGLEAPVFAGTPDVEYVAGTAKPPAVTKKGLQQRVLGIRYRPPAGPVEGVADGESIGGFTCVRTPGHTPGHVSYVHEAHSLVLLGDLVRSTSGGFESAPWVLSADTAAIRRSIRTLVDRVGAFEVGATGHGDPIVGGAGERLRRCLER